MSAISKFLFAVVLSLTMISFVSAQTADTTKSGNNGSNNGNINSNGSQNNRTTPPGSDVTGGAVHSTTPTAMNPAASIEEASNKFMQAINQGDATTAASYYSDDALIMPPDVDIIQGSNGIRNFWAKVISVGGKFDTLTTSKVNVNNETVDEVGHYFLSINRPGQDPMKEKGKFVFVWKRQPDESWKITTHIWNRVKQ